MGGVLKLVQLILSQTHSRSLTWSVLAAVPMETSPFVCAQEACATLNHEALIRKKNIFNLVICTAILRKKNFGHLQGKLCELFITIFDIYWYLKKYLHQCCLVFEKSFVKMQTSYNLEFPDVQNFYY